MTLSTIEIEEGWIAEPCGCAYHPGSNIPRDIGGGMTVVSEGFRRRWCEEHTADLMQRRAEMHYRLYEAPDTPAPNRLERYLQERDLKKGG